MPLRLLGTLGLVTLLLASVSAAVLPTSFLEEGQKLMMVYIGMVSQKGGVGKSTESPHRKKFRG